MKDAKQQGKTQSSAKSEVVDPQPNASNNQRKKLRARAYDHRWKTLVMCVAVGLAIVIGFLVFVEQKGGGFRDSDGNFSLRGNQGFPYSIEATTANTYLKATQDSLVTLDTTLLEFINPANGKSVKSVTHFFTNPVFCVRGKYVLTFDQNRTKLRVDTASQVLFESERKSNIITATIGEDGTFAVATQPNSGKSNLVVYSKSLNELFTWNSTDGYIINMGISTDGNSIAVATVNSINAALKTTVHVFNVKNGKEIKSFHVQGDSVAAIEYVSRNDFYILTKSGCSYIANHDEQTELLKTGEQTMLQYAISPSGALSLLYTQYDNSTSTSLGLYTSNGKLNVTKEISEPVKSIYACGSTTSVLYGEKVAAYRRTGELQSMATASPNTKNFVQLGTKIYLLNTDKIDCEIMKTSK